MNLRRVSTILLHSWYHTTHAMETWIDLLWFPTISLLFFGFLSVMVVAQDPALAQMLIAGYLLWEAVRIAQYCITVSVMWEVWYRSFNTMFVSPVTLLEMMLGYVISGILKTLGTLAIMSVISILAFDFNILSLGWYLLPYLAILLAFGFGAGFFITGLIFRYNTDIQSLAWGLIYLFQPISAIFYPVSILPASIRWTAYLSPITYVMESVRAQLSGAEVSWLNLSIGGTMALISILLGFGFLEMMYRWAKKTGSFARLGS